MNPIQYLKSWFFGKVPQTVVPVSGWQLRPNLGQGPWTKYYNNYVPRKINTQLMEILRETIPVVDAAINRLVSLDGHIQITGNNEALVD